MKGFYLLTIITFITIVIIINIINNTSISENFINNDKLTILFIGDSILNNSNYINNNEKTTFQHFQDIMNNKYDKQNIYLYNYAEDGAIINDCFRQLDRISLNINNNNTKIDNYSNLYIIISCGGNDILNSNNFVDLKQLESKLIYLIKAIQIKFSLANIFILNLYYPFNSKFTIYNNIITSWNNRINNVCLNLNKCKIINISSVINSPTDLIYDIEPSSSGSRKIATNIANNI
jgi:lysophospholipase L1-like esterase